MASRYASLLEVTVVSRSRSLSCSWERKGKREKSSVGSGQLSVICSLLSVFSFLPRIEGLKGLIVEYGMLKK